jgi:RNA polymerase sigma factor (sigma-70 family)
VLRARVPAKPESSPRSRDIVHRYLAEVATRKRLSSSEEYCLAVSAQGGDLNAGRRLIEHQLGLVVMMARRYCGRGLPLLDLIEEGNIGLMTAIEKFDPERGCRFSTYAKWWVRQSIELALMTQANIVRVPVHVTRALKRRSRARATADWTEKDVTEDLPANELRSTSQFMLHDLRDRTDTNALQRDELQTFVDTVAAPEHEQPDWHLQVMSRHKYLHSALLKLKDTERLVLQSRFGLTDDVDRTLKDIARELKVSAERVRQIQGEALSRLRNILQADHGLEHEGLL